ncbi:hypothetical protein EEL31_01985 [Brevibacillus laterosporus]|nr:hypothetical protein [Brevibacillus laterosporus]TPG73167.1 hypothetical protein EEL31_01985 [Brevibacillus laterosporus]
MSLIWANRHQDMGFKAEKKLEKQGKSKQWVVCRQQLINEARNVLFKNRVGKIRNVKYFRH